MAVLLSKCVKTVVSEPGVQSLLPLAVTVFFSGQRALACQEGQVVPTVLRSCVSHLWGAGPKLQVLRGVAAASASIKQLIGSMLWGNPRRCPELPTAQHVGPVAMAFIPTSSSPNSPPVPAPRFASHPAERGPRNS